MNSRMARTVAAGLILLGACGGDGDGGAGPGPGPSGLIGTWRATKVEMVNVANPSQKVELVGLGVTVTIEFRNSGVCQLLQTFPDEPDEVITGTWSSSSEVLTIQYSGSGYSVTWQFEYSLSGSTLTLSGAHGLFDFDGDDVDDEAIMNLVLVRQ